MSGDEPHRPQYGEYATPEEQRARIRQPDPALQPAEPPPTPPVYGATHPYGVIGPYRAPHAAQTGAPADAPPTRGRLGDRVVTAMLLGYGFINVAISVPQYLDLPGMLTSMMTLMKIPGTFTNVDQARTWGLVAAVVLVVGYAVTLMLSLLRLRKRRLTWWVPVVGAAVTYAVVSACIAVPMLSDPAFVSYFTHSGS